MSPPNIVHAAAAVTTAPKPLLTVKLELEVSQDVISSWDIPRSKFCIKLEIKGSITCIESYCRARLTLDLIALSSGVDMVNDAAIWITDKACLDREKSRVVDFISGIYVSARENQDANLPYLATLH